MRAITPTIIARLIYLVSNLRYFEKEWVLDKTWENESVMLKYQADIDDFLEKNNLHEFISENELMEEIIFVRPLKNAM
jgi:hypothetical protein